MKHPVIITTVLSTLLVFSAPAQKNEANRLKDSADGEFVTKAGQGGMAEVELGNLAVERASNDKVKAFGRQMVTDHTNANNDLKALAASKGLSVPDTPDSKSAATKNRLSRLHGAAFDRAYMHDMVNDHQHDIADFQQEAAHGMDSDVKAFASKTLPTLQHHLKMAQEAQNAVSK